MSRAPESLSLPLVLAWLEELKKRVDESELGIDTAANYRNHFLKMIEWLLQESDQGDNAAYIQQCLCDSTGLKVGQYLLHISAKYKPSALRTHLCSLRQAFAWLHLEHSTLSPELIRKPAVIEDIETEDPQKASSRQNHDDSEPQKSTQEVLTPLVELWLKGMSSPHSEYTVTGDLLTSYLCFVEDTSKTETLAIDEIEAYKFILRLSKRGPVSRYIDNENEMPEWVLYSRVGYVLLCPKEVLSSFVAHSMATGQSFELLYKVLLEFYQWASKKGASPYRESAISDILTEAWSDLQN
jgi:hypothetical protein